MTKIGGELERGFAVFCSATKTRSKILFNKGVDGMKKSFPRRRLENSGAELC